MSETEKGCTGMRNAMPGPQNLKESDSDKLLVHQGKYDSAIIILKKKKIN